jgi:xylulokinase
MSEPPPASRPDDGPAVVGVDVGTSSIRALAFDARGRRLAAAARPTPLLPRPTGGEYDPETLFAIALESLTEVATALAGRPVAGIAVASIGETCILIDAAGRPVAPSILWHDRRTAAEAALITEALGADRIFALSGHSAEPIFTLAKLIWMRRHWPDACARATRLFSVADWIAFRLSGVAATDPTLASRTLLYDIRCNAWSPELLDLAGYSTDLPPPLRPSGTPLGPLLPSLAAATGLADAPVVAVGGHDHIIGAVATGLTEPGAVVDSIGTAEALLLATKSPLTDPAALARGYVQGAIAADRPLFYLCGSLQSAGGAIEWLRTLLGAPPQAELIAAARAVPPGSGGVSFLPHLVNSPPPLPDARAGGAFFGLDRTTGPAALYRATLEGLALQGRLMLDGMASLPGVAPPGAIRLIGGATRNPLLVQLKSDAYARPVLVVEEPEATALGAAICAAVAAGLHPSFAAAVRALDRRERQVDPDPATAETYARLADRHAAALARLRAVRPSAPPR